MAASIIGKQLARGKLQFSRALLSGVGLEQGRDMNMHEHHQANVAAGTDRNALSIVRSKPGPEVPAAKPCKRSTSRSEA